jgi:hypothetical protein
LAGGRLLAFKKYRDSGADGDVHAIKTTIRHIREAVDRDSARDETAWSSL